LLRVDQVVDGIDVDRHAVRNVDRHALDGSDHAPARAAAAGIGPRTTGRRPRLRRAGLRDPFSSEAVLVGAARRQQAAYRALARHPEWDAIARLQIPPSLLYVYDRNVDARRQLTAIGASAPKDTLPAWRIDPPAPADELLGYYRKAEAATGVGWVVTGLDFNRRQHATLSWSAHRSAA
jgi:hypothetical protein